MSTTITFTVPGVAKGKARPRFSRRGKFTVAYTPTETVRRENLVALFYKQAAPSLPPHSGAVRLLVEATYAMPQSWSGKKLDAMRGQYKCTKPDWDNVGKLVSDALNAIAWTDDAVVADGQVKKVWGDVDSMSVTIERI